MRKVLATLLFITVEASLLFSMSPPSQGQGTAPQGGGFGGLLILFVPLMLIWYFLLIRPQQKKEKQRQEMIKNLKKGDEVLTIGGIYGQIAQVKENRINLKIADKVIIEVAKSAISGKVSR